jgi:hypothetical protein
MEAAMGSTVTSNPVYIPRKTNDGTDTLGRSDRSRSTGSLGGNTVEFAPVPNLPAKSSGIGARIANFFTSSLPGFFSATFDSILSMLRPAAPAQPQHAETAPPPSASRTAPPFNPAINAGLNVPFSKERMDDLRDEMRQNIDPGNLKGSMADIAIAERGDCVVASTFALDINRATEPYRFNNKPMNDVMGARSVSDRDASELPRVLAWCDSMESKGVNPQDMVVLTRIINQSTLAIFQAQYFLRPDLASPLKTPDGKEIPMAVNFTTRDWNISETEKGFNIDFAGGGALKALPATDGTKVKLGEGSYAELNFRVVLERDDAGKLQVAAIADCLMTVDAYDRQGQSLT